MFNGTCIPFSGMFLGPGNFLMVSLTSDSIYSFGNLASNSLTLSYTYSSLVLPPPPELSFGLVSIIV